MTADPIQQLRDAEECLLQPEFRRSADRVAALLANEFIEFGSSGKVYTKQQTLDALTHTELVQTEMQNFRAIEIAVDTFLVTYRAVQADGSSSLRSSLWKRKNTLWQIIFHQGTPVQHGNMHT